MPPGTCACVVLICFDRLQKFETSTRLINNIIRTLSATRAARGLLCVVVPSPGSGSKVARRSHGVVGSPDEWERGAEAVQVVTDT